MMPVKLGRLGLGESPWEHVRNHVFEWGYEGKGIKSGGTKNGVPLPQPVKPTRGGTPPHLFLHWIILI